MAEATPSFQRYQQEFCAHLRDPICQPRPENVTVEGMAVYKEIVFNNLFESVSACFPVAQMVLGKRAWLRLVKGFLREHSATSPIFREIPEEFLKFLPSQIDLPPYLTNLCHYEWVELLVAFMPAPSETAAIKATGDLLANQLAFSPALQLLNYDYAVHKISARYKPKNRLETQLLVYRNTEDIVKFIEINLVTYRLIELLRQSAITGEQALMIIANEINQKNPESLIQFGLEVLENLRSQGVILGIKATSADLTHA
jgi:hypothetical protein